MKAKGKFMEVVVKVCAVCMGIIIVDTAYNKGKRDAYKECLNIVKDGLAELEMEKEEEEAQ